MSDDPPSELFGVPMQQFMDTVKLGQPMGCGNCGRQISWGYRSDVAARPDAQRAPLFLEAGSAFVVCEDCYLVPVEAAVSDGPKVRSDPSLIISPEGDDRALRRARIVAHAANAERGREPVDLGEIVREIRSAQTDAHAAGRLAKWLATSFRWTVPGG